MTSPITRLKKKFNYYLIEWQKRKLSTIIFGYPYWLTVDPTNLCNLRCVFCPTGQQRGSRPSVVLSLPRFKRILRTLGPYLIHVDFCNWGEPLLNKDLFEMIRLAKQYGPTTKVDSNLNVPLSEADAEALVRSGLDSLNMSVDGATQETYQKYRRNGNIDTVFKNMKLLVAAKKRLGSPTPRLHWQFLVFRHNEHEIELAKALAREIGVDGIGFTGPFCSPEWVPTIDEYNNYLPRPDGGVSFKNAVQPCTWLWDAVTINADGSVSPCCSVEDKKDDFTDFFGKPFFWMWNSRNFRIARRFVRDRVARDAGNVCTRCDHIGASNHSVITKQHLQRVGIESDEEKIYV